MPKRTLEERFWSKVDKNGPVPAHKPELGPCWIWTASFRRDGYGQISMPSKDGRRRPVAAHRVAFFIANGRWPEPCALHHCDNHACVRESGHLFEGTMADNMADKITKGRANAAKGDASGPRRHPERMPRGEASGMAKLTDDSVREIRRLYAIGGYSYRRLGSLFGVSHTVVKEVILGRTWRHVPP